MENLNRVYFKSCFNPIESVHVNVAIVSLYTEYKAFGTNSRFLFSQYNFNSIQKMVAALSILYMQLV